MTIRAIDPWVNVSMGEQKPPEYLIRVKEDYFKGGDEFFKNIEASALVEEMDACGVEKEDQESHVLQLLLNASTGGRSAAFLAG